VTGLSRRPVDHPRLLRPFAPSLRDPQADLADACVQDLRLEAVGVAVTVGGSLMRLGLEHLLPLDLHGMVHEGREGGGHGIRAMLDRQINEVADRRTIFLVGHRRFLLGGVSTSKKASNDPPFQIGGR